MRIQSHIFFFCLIMSATFFGCDDDEKFRIITRQSYLFMEDSLSSPHLVNYDNLTRKFTQNYHKQFGVSELGLSDMDGKDNEVCLSDYLQPSVKYVVFKEKMNNFSAKSSAETISHTLVDFVPHRIALGDNYIIALDTIARKLAFMDKNSLNKEIIYKQSDKKPVLAFAFMGRFYVATEEKTIQIWEESAFAMREELSTQRRIDYITPDDFSKSVSLSLLYHSGDSLFSATLSLNNNNITKNTLINYRKILNSPYNTLSYGKEWLGQVKLLKTGGITLTDDNGTDEFTVGASSMDFDFSNSVLFCTQHNELRVFENLNDSTLYTGLPVTGKIRKAFFKSGYSGN